MLRRRILFSALVALFAAVATISPASAQPAVLAAFDLQTAAGAEPSDGSARATGTVTFLSKSKVRIVGRINDRCPPDGYGAYLYMTGAWANGDAIWAPPRLVAADTHQCGSSADGYPFDETFNPNSTRTIAWISLNVYEIDVNTGRYGDVSPAQRFWNPYR
jgi:hypothetical protein